MAHGRTRQTGQDGEDTELGLTVKLQLRVSPEADRMIRTRAKRAGVKKGTWMRVEIYKVLGLIDD